MTSFLVLFGTALTLLDAQCEPCFLDSSCALSPHQLYTCTVESSTQNTNNQQQNASCVEYRSLCDACIVPCKFAANSPSLDADQIFTSFECKKANYDCSGMPIQSNLNQPSSILIEYLGYFVLFILLLTWICFKVIRHCLCANYKSQSIAPIANINIAEFEDIGNHYELLENNSNAPQPQPPQIYINPQQKYSKSMFELIHQISEIVNCTVFLIYIEYFTQYTADSYVYTVCAVFYAMKIVLFICNITDNILIFCTYGSLSDDFIFYFTITTDMIHYHLSLMDGMFKLIYSFPMSWDMNPSTFWNVTFSLSFAALNGAFLPIKYDLRQMSVMKDEIIRYYEGTWRDKCCYTFLLKTIEYSAKLIAFIPIFVSINTITAGLSVINIVTKTNIYAIFFGFMWIFGIYISLGFRQIKLNFFADLTLYILVVNFCEVIDVSVMTATVWLYGHFNGPSMNWLGLGDGNLVPDDHYYGYTLSSWILYIALFFLLWQIYPLIYAFCSGAAPMDCTGCNMLVYGVTFPLAILVGIGLYIQPILYSLVAISGIFNLMVFGGSLIRIISYNVKEICILFLVIVLCVGGYFIISAAF